MDKSRILMASIAGAAIGSFLGYLFFTPQGRKLRVDLEAALEDAVGELIRFRSTVAKASAAASEGWRLLDDFGDALGHNQSARYANPHQTDPF